MITSINIIGAGRVGQTLGRLWQEAGFTIAGVYRRDLSQAHAAVDFIGAGNACANINELPPADTYLISTADSYIAQTCEALVAAAKLKSGAVVLHLSGALASDILAPARAKGASVASVHPIFSFPEPSIACQQFAGSYCGIEGDELALKLADELFTAIQANPLRIKSDAKLLYHSALVMSSNYVVALVQSAVELLQQSGLGADDALAAISPLLKGCVQQTLELGPSKALTGPIARGDVDLVRQEMVALGSLNDKQYQAIYSLLGKQAAQMAYGVKSLHNTAKPNQSKFLAALSLV